MASQAHISLVRDEQDLSPLSFVPATADVTPCVNLAKKVLSNLATLDDGSTKADSNHSSGKPPFVSTSKLGRDSSSPNDDTERAKLLHMLAAAHKNLQPKVSPTTGSRKENIQHNARVRTAVGGKRVSGAVRDQKAKEFEKARTRKASQLLVQRRPTTVGTHGSAAKIPCISSQDQQQVKQTKITEYSLGNQIGQGAYAVVKQGFHKQSGRKAAIKIYEKYRISDAQRKASVNREIKLLQRLTHDNIVRLYETIDTPKQLFLIMELVRGRSLYSYVRSKPGRRLSEPECIKIFRQIADGVEYCHRNNVTHRDIKMENILIDEDLNVKIIDFGFSICAGPSQRLKVFCGTPSYMAPEIVNRKEYIGPPTDMWSLGILLFALLCGNFPFRGSTDHELFRNISKGKVAFPSFASANLKGIVTRLLRLDPQSRATAKEIMADPVLNGGNRPQAAGDSGLETNKGDIAAPMSDIMPAKKATSTGVTNVANQLD